MYAQRSVRYYRVFFYLPPVASYRIGVEVTLIFNWANDLFRRVSGKISFGDNCSHVKFYTSVPRKVKADKSYYGKIDYSLWEYQWRVRANRDFMSLVQASF